MKNDEPCPKCDSLELPEMGFGLAYGGYGAYSYCPNCGHLYHKSQEPTDDKPLDTAKESA